MARDVRAGSHLMVVRSAVKRSAYYDSVTLMQAQQALRALPGVEEAGVVMGTEANVALLRQAGLVIEDASAKADDLIVAVRADTEAHARGALDALDGILSRRPAATPPDAAYRPRTVAAAARMLSGANVALVSVPGRFAAAAAREALRAGLHVMLFSDNVPLDEEIRLKRDAARGGRLVMGPDCGTALIGGAALGFANRVRRGPVGIVSASGTGLQEVATITHRRGGGVSHALGTGGRDLAAAVGAATTRRALVVLGRDPATAVIVLVSKPPDPEVADRVLEDAAGIGKPVVVAFVGASPQSSAGGLYWAATLEDAAMLAARLAGGAPRDPNDEGAAWRPAVERRAAAEIDRLAPSQQYLRGLYSGGTLCAECVAVLQGALRPLFTNAPVGAARHIDGVGPSRAHTVLDLGDDLFTVGRLHPMLDPTLRAQRIAQEAADPETAVILLDVVLGEGVHADPAGALAPAIAAARAGAAGAGRHLAVVASVCGTDEDPQSRVEQVRRLAAAGVLVEDSNVRAVALAGMIAGRDPALPLPPLRSDAAVRDDADGESGPAVAEPHGTDGRDPHPEDALLAGPPRVVNVGLEIFAKSLRAQGVAVLELDWRPPAGGDRDMIALLERLE
ncbi:MAG TPA: acyl-CoA synthetase FdrA [bacterium]|nr:acyl-CoA synthetase FdrA [bacterium]